jgi:hypothetical protein
MTIVNPNPNISFCIGFSPVKTLRAGIFAGTFFHDQRRDPAK